MKISLSNIKKIYNEKQVLDIDLLEIEKGKITGIIGPNGSGKSTLLNIIAGLDEKYLGTIIYDQEVINREIYNKMTLVSQKPYLFRRKVYYNIEYPLRVRNINKADIKKKVNEIIDRLEINELKEKKAHLLSGGESQKVSLARALVFEPKLLLLDEPTSNIDPESIKVLEREILRFNKETKATVIIVTHNLEQSDRICDNIIYLENGRVSL
ncbi:ATP-binding cassette domain-containing protein [Proteiniborus sp.]|uniref:ABC transporter ATP-binding protein n=1 Tax=Proteiniborus sp. TaxID=2079015 RepID=UPI0033173508